MTKKRKFRNSDDNNECNHTTNDDLIEVIDNHIYFYSDITQKSIFSLNKNIRKLNIELLNESQRLEISKPKIYIHINSMGGEVFAALSAVDTIIASKIPIISIIEGYAASSATLISIVASERHITKHSSILIHQLSSGFWGKYLELKDEFENLTYLENLTKDIYNKHSNNKLSENKLNRFLKRDIWWDSSKALKLGLVDKIV